ncbi:uncharacterized protein BDV17DRAFT_256293 [Aspergillus undulatus]|uniref:uncharacterized protein n=1 Tax=Aspergillus undulatus TaxID=1810928 RepID=UPI003CCD5C62
MNTHSRHKSLVEFENNKAITILIVSLRTGGTGLDMTVAFRCGQTREVECVKMVVKDSIDEYMVDLQAGKTEDIASTMGDDILKKKGTVVALLKLFTDVDQDESGFL